MLAAYGLVVFMSIRMLTFEATTGAYTGVFRVPSFVRSIDEGRRSYGAGMIAKKCSSREVVSSSEEKRPFVSNK